MSNFFASEPKEIISESLQELLPVDDISNLYYSSFITVAFASDDPDNPIIGSLVGIEICDETYKIDIKIPMQQAFNYISEFFEKRNAQMKDIVFSFSEQVKKLQGLFNIKGIKIIELDANNKLCVLAIDLIKTEPETP